MCFPVLFGKTVTRSAGGCFGLLQRVAVHRLWTFCGLQLPYHLDPLGMDQRGPTLSLYAGAKCFDLAAVPCLLTWCPCL